MNRDEMILKLYSLYPQRTYLGWLENQTDAQLEIFYRRAFKI